MMDAPRNPKVPQYLIVIDDDSAVRDSLRFSLAIEGYDVRAYAGAEELLAESTFPVCDCLIVDQNMVGMSGLDLIATLRARRIDAPAILITTHPNAALRERAAVNGVPIVEKPLLGPILSDSVRRVVTQRAT
jgi:FixJ family two-component response regulator